MRYRKLDANGDFVFGYAPVFLQNTSETVAQAVLTRLRLTAGDWFLDSNEGLDLKQILGYGTQQTRDRQIQARILGTPGVLAITKYSSSVANRVFAVNAEISTIYGPTTISGVL